MRIIVGDPHGCLTEFETLVRKVGYQRDRDSLVIVGDLLDRGPDPVGVVTYAMEIGAYNVRGNHEDNALRWLRYEERVRKEPGFVNPMEASPVRQRVPHANRAPSRPLTPEEVEKGRLRREAKAARGEVTAPIPKRPVQRRPIPEDHKAQWRALSPEQVRWLDSSWYIDLTDKWYVVHAGVEARPFQEQVPDRVMRIRYVDPETGYMIAYDEGSLDQPKGSVPWQAMWEGPQSIIYGHAVHSRKVPRIDVRETKHGLVRCYGIDTGCCFGGRLTAIVFEDEAMESHPEFVQVDALKEYIPSPGPIPDEVF